MAFSSSSSAASDQNKLQNEMKQQTTNPGKPCHQCRHKPRTFAVTCKNQNKPKNQRTNKPQNQGKNKPENQRKTKPCTLVFCHECLVNRYGEKAEEVNSLEEWICPKCRGDCNCSCCMKKRGQEPTGILWHRAKAAGYSSVSELLHADGHENFGHVKNAKDNSTSLKKQGASGKGKKIVVAEGIVLDVQPLTAIPHHSYTMEEMNYPSGDEIKEVDEEAEDVTKGDAEIPQSLDPENPNSSAHQTTVRESPVLLLNVPFANISSEIAVPDSTHSIEKNIEEFVDDISDFEDHPHVKDPMFPATFEGAPAMGITVEENSKLVRKIGLAENHAAGRKRLTYHTLPDSPEKRKATEEEIARVNQQIDKEVNKKRSDELVALRNDVDHLTAMITGIDKTVSVMSRDVTNISKNVRTQATTSFADHQDLVKRVNLLQQSQDANRETQLHILSRLMEISNRLGISDDDVKKREKKLVGTSCEVEADQKKDDGGDTHGPEGGM